MRQPSVPVAAAIGVALLAAAGVAAAGSRETDIPATLSPKLAAALKGRTVGKPVDCVSLARIRSTRIVDHTAIIYEESQRRWYVNFPDRGRCAALAPHRAIVSRTSTTQLCSLDIIRIIDPPTPIEYGACGLGPFVPYTK